MNLAEKVNTLDHKLQTAHEQTASAQKAAERNAEARDKAEARAEELRCALVDLRLLYMDLSAAYTTILGNVIDGE